MLFPVLEPAASAAFGQRDKLMKVIAFLIATALFSTVAYADVRQHVTNAAMQHGVPTALALAIVKHESNFNSGATGRAGEIGLGQIKCRTARGVGFRGACRALYAVEINLHYSMKYLAQAWHKAGSFCGAATLYNQGIGAHVSCSAYGRQVVRNLRKHR